MTARDTLSLLPSTRSKCCHGNALHTCDRRVLIDMSPVCHRTLSIQVDEDHVKTVSLLPGRFSHLSPASFFIGGVPLGAESLLPSRLQEVSLSFRGCLQHLVLGGA